MRRVVIASLFVLLLAAFFALRARADLLASAGNCPRVASAAQASGGHAFHRRCAVLHSPATTSGPMIEAGG